MATRIYTANLAGREFDLAATFGASVEISDKIADPLTIMREAAMESVFALQQIPYEPRWRFTVKNIPQILFIGVKAAGGKLKLEELQELCFEAGFPVAREVASEYLALIVGPRPEEVKDEGRSEGN